MSSNLGKVKAFNIQAKKNLSKKDMEKQKKQMEEEAAAEAYQEFVATFEEPISTGKLFVRGSVINPGSGEEQSSSTGRVYKPPKLQEYEQKKRKEEHTTTTVSSSKIEKPAKRKDKEKKKSNLELFKEELKLIQEEREERHKVKQMMKKEGQKPEAETVVRLPDDTRYTGFGSFDTGDPNTTNIYLGNINPKMTEQQLMEVFGKYGPLASVKIMWPRSDEERARNRNCGFVAFMNRKDGERALKALNVKEIMGYEMKLGWGKAVPIPPHPVYIPPKLMELTMPPPPSGLPFNAQALKEDVIPEGIPWPLTKHNLENFDQVVQNAVVKVVIPTDRTLLCLIHRMIEFVVREGPMFEAMIMNREINNPMFRFLFDNQSPAHVYYRWRLFSILQGEHPSKWKIEEFRMFKGGSIWRPPPLNPFLQGMPEEFIEEETDDDPIPKDFETRKEKTKTSKDHHKFKETKEYHRDIKKSGLSDSQREKFEDMLRNLTPDRSKILEAMIYCIDHADAAEEIVECITESLSILETPLHRKISRLYLISDVLHNCSVKVSNASYYRKGFQTKLLEIFHNMHDCFNNIEGRLKAEQFKQRVMNCFRAWEDWTVYTSDFLIKLQNVFLGLVQRESERKQAEVEDVDGVPIDDADLDGVPIEDVNVNESTSRVPKFKPSKWETVDPDVVEQQAMTTSKWEQLDIPASGIKREDYDDDDVDGRPMDSASGDDSRSSLFLEQLKNELNEERRNKLREIEVKVLKFQDELESGRRSRKTEITLLEQVEEFRRKLIKKENFKPDETKSRSPSPYSRERSSSYSAKKKRSRSKSPASKSKKSPSRQPHHHQKSRSSLSSSKRRKSRSPSPTYKSQRR